MRERLRATSSSESGAVFAGCGTSPETVTERVPFFSVSVAGSSCRMLAVRSSSTFFAKPAKEMTRREFSLSTSLRTPHMEESVFPVKYPSVNPSREKASVKICISVSFAARFSSSRQRKTEATSRTYSGDFMRPSILSEETPKETSFGIWFAKERSLSESGYSPLP